MRCVALQVSGIPKLVLIDGEGKVISEDGRGVVMSDPLGEKFPWNVTTDEPVEGPR